MSRKSKKQPKREESEESEEELFAVEVITQARVNDDVEWEYYVKWAGYDSEHDSWEPEDNLHGCEQLLRSFWKHIGLDDEDYPVGHVVRARSDWIKVERKLFAKTMKEEEKEKKKRRREKQKGKNKHSEEEDEDEDEDEELEVEETLGAKGKDREKGGSERGKDKDKGKKVSSKKKEREESPKKNKEKRKSHKPPLPTPSPPPKRGKEKGKAKQTDVVREDAGNKLISSDDIPLTDPPTEPMSEDEVPLISSQKSVSTALKRRIESPQNEPNPAKGFTSQKNGDRPAPKRPRISIDTNVQSQPVSTVTEKSLSHQTRSPSPASDKDSLFSRESTPEVPLAPVAAKTMPPPKPAVSVPAHRAPPKIKLMDLPSKAVAGGSALSTKQRIVQGVQGVSSPTIPAPRPPIPRKGSSSLANLSFKKNAVQGSRNVNARADSGAAPTASPSTPASQMNWFAHSPVASSADFVDSPVSVDHEIPPTTPEATFMHPDPGPSRVQNFPTPANANKYAEVDRFLAQIMPPALAAPMEEDRPMASPTLPAPPRTTMKPSLGRIPKKWKWNGDLFLQRDSEKAEQLCQIALTEPTDHSDGLRFSICFSSVDSLRLQKLLHISMLDILFSSCAKPQQIAKLGPHGESDSKPLERLAKFMLIKQKMSYARLVVNNITLGILLVFPAVMVTLADRFKVPLDLRGGGYLTAVLLPYRLTSTRYEKYKWQGEGKLPVGDGTLDSKRAVPEARTPARVLQAIHLLNFPQWLYSHMHTPNRPYCIWNTSDGTVENPGRETVALRAVLKHCNAVDVGRKADVRVVFVHVGSVKTLNKLPALVERRCRRHEIQFITYGTHESVPVSRWGVRSIFPLGGIVTFTPSSIVEKPIAVFELITQIAEHPLWQCYITPSVLAAVYQMVYKGQHLPTPLNSDSDPFYYRILDLVHEGQILLIQTPPLHRGAASGKDPQRDWISLQTVLMSLQGRGLLEDCTRIYLSEYANVHQLKLASAVTDNISRGLDWVQSRPMVMDEYRRFVVIIGSQDTGIPWDRDGFEWVTVSKFSFKDDFFLSPT